MRRAGTASEGPRVGRRHLLAHSRNAGHGAVHLAADSVDPGALRFGPLAVLERIEQLGDLFAPVLTLRQTVA
jgi:hypothetical protein